MDIAAKADGVDGPRRDALVKLAQAVGDAVKETMMARRAGERVKRDLDREPDKLSKDESDAVPTLRAHDKLQALVKMDAGDLTKRPTRWACSARSIASISRAGYPST